MPGDQLLKVILHHVGCLVPLTDDGDDWHLDRRKREALGLETIAWHHVERPKHILEQVVLAAMESVTIVREEWIHCFLGLALLE